MTDDLRTGPRRALVDALRRVEPTSPTMCEGWQARHLAAHVVLRERAPLQMAVAKARGEDGAISRGNEITDLAGYEALVREVEEGPGPLSPVGWSATANVLELHVHALDVLRAPGGPAWEPVELGEETSRALWRSFTAMARLGWARPGSRGGVGVVAVVPGGRRTVLARGDRSVVLTGDPLEIAMVVTGRQRASLATLGGPDDAVAAFRTATGWDAPANPDPYTR